MTTSKLQHQPVNRWLVNHRSPTIVAHTAGNSCDDKWPDTASGASSAIAARVLLRCVLSPAHCISRILYSSSLLQSQEHCSVLYINATDGLQPVLHAHLLDGVDMRKLYSPIEPTCTDLA